MKFALVSHVLPPTSSGQAMVLYKLLQDLDPQQYCLISCESYNGQAESDGYSAKLSGRYHYLPSENRIRRGSGPFPVWRERANILYALYQRARNIAAIIRNEKCDAIVACTGGSELLDLPASYLASRMVGVAFYPYMFDHYLHQWLALKTFWPRAKHPVIARRFESICLKGSADIIVPNEFLQNELHRLYRVTSTIVRNPCDVADYVAFSDGIMRKDDGEIRIVYTGAVYEAHFDAFRNLMAALRRLERPEVKLHLYTAQPPAALMEQGIEGAVVFHDHQALSEMPRIQCQADLLFLPLAFNSPYPEIIRTSAPGKIGEYLAARRPILAHAPADSFIAWYFRQHECGVVADQNDPAMLAQAIERLLNDCTLRQRISANAWERACKDFNLSVAREGFLSVVQSPNR